MSYLRFLPPEMAKARATIATVATLHDPATQTVASVATVAGPTRRHDEVMATARTSRDPKTPPATIATVATTRALPGAFDAVAERAAILEFDAGLPRPNANDVASQHLGFANAADFRRQLLSYWRCGLQRLLDEGQGQKGDALIRTALAFVRDGWADQALDRGWTEQELVWADGKAPWDAYDRLGAAYLCDGVRLITASSIEVMNRTGSRLTLLRTRGDGRGGPPWEGENA